MRSLLEEHMRLEYSSQECFKVVCDFLAYPIFEDEGHDSKELEPLQKSTRGIVRSLMTSGEFKPELHKTCLIHAPGGMKAGRLLLIGAGKRRDFNLARLRELAGVAVRAMPS